jgi:diaminopimelate decarboxylase
MASRYNARPLPAEVVVRGNEFFVTRQAEALEDLVAGETIPPDITPVS